MKKVHISRMTIISLFIFFLSACGIASCIIKILDNLKQKDNSGKMIRENHNGKDEKHD